MYNNMFEELIIIHSKENSCDIYTEITKTINESVIDIEEDCNHDDRENGHCIDCGHVKSGE